MSEDTQTKTHNENNELRDRITELEESNKNLKGMLLSDNLEIGGNKCYTTQTRISCRKCKASRMTSVLEPYALEGIYHEPTCLLLLAIPSLLVKGLK